MKYSMTTTGGYHNFEVIKGDGEPLKCVDCKGLVKDAKELPCGHLICEICFQSLVKIRLVIYVCIKGLLLT